MSETEKQMADRVLVALSTGRYTHPNAAVREIAPLREQVGTGKDVERERAEVWLSICALHQALSAHHAQAEIDERWQKAIDAATTWVASFK